MLHVYSFLTAPLFSTPAPACWQFRNTEHLCGALINDTGHSKTEQSVLSTRTQIDHKRSFQTGWGGGGSHCLHMHGHKQTDRKRTLSLSLEKSVYLLKTTQLSSGVFLTRILNTCEETTCSICADGSTTLLYSHKHFCVKIWLTLYREFGSLLHDLVAQQSRGDRPFLLVPTPHWLWNGARAAGVLHGWL